MSYPSFLNITYFFLVTDFLFSSQNSPFCCCVVYVRIITVTEKTRRIQWSPVLILTSVTTKFLLLKQLLIMTPSNQNNLLYYCLFLEFLWFLFHMTWALFVFDKRRQSQKRFWYEQFRLACKQTVCAFTNKVCLILCWLKCLHFLKIQIS